MTAIADVLTVKMSACPGINGIDSLSGLPIPSLHIVSHPFGFMLWLRYSFHEGIDKVIHFLMPLRLFHSELMIKGLSSHCAENEAIMYINKCFLER